MDRQRALIGGISGTFLRYCVGAVVSFGMSLGLTWFLHDIALLSPELAFAAALVVVHVLNFFINRHYIYQAATGSALQQLWKFTGSAAVFRAAAYLGFLLLHSVMGIPYLVTAAAVLGLQFLGKFFFYGSKVFLAAGTELTADPEIK
jgi:putative flippase GtrA